MYTWWRIFLVSSEQIITINNDIITYTSSVFILATKVGNINDDKVKYGIPLIQFASKAINLCSSGDSSGDDTHSIIDGQTNA